MAATLEERVEQELRLRGVQRPPEKEEEEAAAQGEAEAEDGEKKKEKRLPRFNAHSVFWIVAAVSATYYSDFFPVVHANIQEGCVWLTVGGLSLLVSLAITLYCIIYLECLCGINDYDARHPGLVPIAVMSFLVAAVCLNVSLWSAWSFLTPAILFTQFMGSVMLVSLFG
ncbi:transmembrane protein 128 isoform 2-T2 [Anomaloglossus baeobatrachus]